MFGKKREEFVEAHKIEKVEVINCVLAAESQIFQGE